MIRFFLFTVLFYVLFLIVSSVIRAFLGWTKRREQSKSPQVDPSATPKAQVEYKNVADAKFEDIPKANRTKNQSENNS